MKMKVEVLSSGDEGSEEMVILVKNAKSENHALACAMERALVAAN